MADTNFLKHELEAARDTFDRLGHLQRQPKTLGEGREALRQSMSAALEARERIDRALEKAERFAKT